MKWSQLLGPEESPSTIEGRSNTPMIAFLEIFHIYFRRSLEKLKRKDRNITRENLLFMKKQIRMRNLLKSLWTLLKKMKRRHQKQLLKKSQQLKIRQIRQKRTLR